MFRRSLALTAVGAASLALPAVASAAASFSTSLQSTPGSGFEVVATSAGQAITFDPAGATFGSVDGGDGGRNIIRTTATDFDEQGFTAAVTVTNPSGSRNAFLGLGAGGFGDYNVPDVNFSFEGNTANGDDSVLVDSKGSDLEAFRQQDQSFVDILGSTGTAPNTVTSVRLGLTYVVAAGVKTATFTADFNADGTIDKTTGPIDVSALFTGAEPARVFIGGDDGVTLANFTATVVPEPASAALLALGGLAMLRRRQA